MFVKQGLKSGLRNANQILPGISRKKVAICANMVQPRNIRAFCAARSAKKWDLYSGICLERHPVIIKPMHELELKFYNMLKQIEIENSMKCDHELKVEEEKRHRSSKNANDDNQDTVTVQTMQDFEDSYKDEFDNFKFAPTVTKFDEQKVTSSLERELDKNLLLLVQQRLGDKDYWIPPQGIRKEGETMRQTAERVLQDACGTEVKVKFYGNAPVGFYKYAYPKKLREQGSYGAKIFYFLAKYVDGNVNNNVKHQWLNHEEFERELPNEMKKSISQFMLFT